MASVKSLKRELAYWTAQGIGWGLYFIILFLSIVAFSKLEISFWSRLSLQLIIVLSCLGGSHLLRFVYKKQKWTLLPLGKAVVRVVIACMIVAIFVQIFIHIFIFLFFKWASVNGIIWSRVLTYLMNVFCVFLGWSVFYFGFHYYERGQQMQLANLKAEAALKEAELLALKAQINPHFLFNALNNIRALILEDPSRARDMVSHLSELLRYSIQFQEQERVLLKTEMEIVQDYLQLESIQYEDRLNFELDIAPETEHKKIPPMVIQLLVENAVKHGISQLPGGGTINVKTRIIKDQLHIEVENTGQLSNEKGSGIGIQNVLERIRILFDGEPYFSLKETDGVVSASLQLPAI